VGFSETVGEALVFKQFLDEICTSVFDNLAHEALL
jgi:hypothetical protein